MGSETEEWMGEEEASIGYFVESLPLWAPGDILLAISGRQDGAHTSGVPAEGQGSWGVHPPTPTSPWSPCTCAHSFLEGYEAVPFYIPTG